MTFDYKKEYREFYLPPKTPVIVNVPIMNYIAIRGTGDPNIEDGAYKRAIGALYAVAYTIKMSKKGARQLEGYFDFVVPPLEGFWWQRGVEGVDYSHKEDFEWISVIRLPEFVDKEMLAWAAEQAENKKGIDCSSVEFLTVDEGLCVQCMHYGPYDDEPETVRRMHEHALANGCVLDINEIRHHHEIYLSDARKTAPEKLKTVVRHPIKRV